MTTVAKLASVPSSRHELEEYVSALFHAARYFVETNIVERDFQEILELDAVATSYEQATPATVLAEAKGGGWGFADIFKVVGWMHYLDIQRGAFFVAKAAPETDRDAIQNKIAPLGVSLIDLSDLSKAKERFDAAGFQKVLHTILVTIWRFSAWAERRLLHKLSAAAKQNPPKQGPRAALEYYRLVNDSIFFTKDAVDRLAKLYDAYQKHPKLALGVAREMGGGAYDPDATQQSPLIREALLQGKHDLLQACFFLEHRARLSILKAGIDLVCLQEAGKAKGDLPLTLPATFRTGLGVLRKHPAFKRYALFWQVLLWGFGGFILRDREAKEYQALAIETGVPVEQIPSALAAYDILFPPMDSWLANLNGSQCRIVKMMPVQFRGVGAHQRLSLYGAKTYGDLEYSDFTHVHLSTWNNRLVDLIGTKEE